MKKAALALALLMCVTCACDYREINDMSIVSGVAVDYDAQADEYLLTVEIVDPGGSSEPDPSPKYVGSKGKTIYEAVDNLGKKVGKEPYFSHAETLLLGEQAARAGVVGALDWFIRDFEPRLNVNLAVSRGSAANVLRASPSSGALTAYDLAGQIENGDGGVTLKTPLYAFVDMMDESGLFATVPAAGTCKEGEEETACLNGMAYFDGVFSTGFLSDEETESLIFILGKAKNGVVVQESVGEGEANVALEILENESETSAVMEDGLILSVKTRLSADIGENGSSIDFGQGSYRERLKREAEQSLGQKFLALINRMQREGGDIFGFGAGVKKDNPGLWAAVGGAWREYFKNARVMVSVELELEDTGYAARPITEGWS